MDNLFFDIWRSVDTYLLVYKGKIPHETIKKERIEAYELRAFLRRQGLASHEEAAAVVHSCK